MVVGGLNPMTRFSFVMETPGSARHLLGNNDEARGNWGKAAKY